MCNEVHSKNYKSCENQHLSLLLLAIFFSVLKYNIFAFHVCLCNWVPGGSDSFSGSKITADGDCSHEIKRRLLFGRKVMTNLDSIFKSRDITLPTKFRLVKAMIFPVVMYGCESWIVKKTER